MAQDPRLLREAQKIGAKFQFFSVGGDLHHLLGYLMEVNGIKYQIEIIFKDDFPAVAPQFIYSRPITNLLGSTIPLNTLANWTEDSEVVAVVEELREMIESTLAHHGGTPAGGGPALAPKTSSNPPRVKASAPKPIAKPVITPAMKPTPSIVIENSPPQEEQWVTPDFTAFPDPEVQAFLASQDQNAPPPPPGIEQEYGGEIPPDMFYHPSPPLPADSAVSAKFEPSSTMQEIPETDFNEPESAPAAEQMTLIQQEYSADPYGPGRAQIFMAITIEQNFILKVEFNDYPVCPRVILPPSIMSVLGDPYKAVKVLVDWQEDQPADVVKIIREIEQQLFSLKDAEIQAKEILGEFRAEKIDGSIARLHVYVMTFGFKEFLVEIDLSHFPNPPGITFSPELADLLQIKPEDLDMMKHWKSKSSQIVDVIREISWLVDKNSRLKFELDLIENGIKDVNYDPTSNELRIKMRGEMKTKDVTFEFKVAIPQDYPTAPPTVDLATELDEDQEDIRKGIDKSMKDYFAQWNTFSFLIDLFNAISKAIFNVSVLTCVLCHKIECPSCNAKIAAPEGEETCQSRCPHCERDYHKHCWDQTIEAFGKCGFCLRVP